MKTKYLTSKLDYDGSQLRSLFAYETAGVLGNSIVSFEGSCDIPFKNMIDGEDRFENQAIRGGHMLHFIVEKFPAGLFEAVCLQRLIATLATDLVRKKTNLEIRRDGDDVFVADGKLSISVATVSPVSSVIHFAVNVTNENTPVKTACLKDLNIDSKYFAETLMQSFAREFDSIDLATQKVFPAHGPR